MRAILTYHSIDASGSPISLPPEVFARHVEWLAAGGVAVLELPALVSEPAGPPAVAITFDDALESFDRLAWPALREHCLPVTVFVPVGRAGRDNRWDGRPAAGIPTLGVLGLDRLAALAEEGVTLGSHGLRHRDLRRLPDGELEEELAGSRERLAAVTGRAPESFAYPFGRAGRREAEAARSIYRVACTDRLAALSGRVDPLLCPRIDAWYARRPGALRRWGSASHRLRLRLRAALRAGRRRLTGS